jgi:hypothetical protein
MRKKAATERIAGLWLPKVVETYPKITGPMTAEDFPASEYTQPLFQPVQIG